MNDSLSFFDAPGSVAAKHEAMDRVDAHADLSWKTAAKQSVEAVAERRPEFTTDAVWWWLAHYFPECETPERRAMGPIMNWAVRSQLIQRTDRTAQSQRAACHARPLTVWRSQVRKDSG